MSRKRVERVDMVQSELDQLQRRFRDMEAKYRLFNDDSVQTIRMQRQKISKLKRDNDRLKEELALETRQAKMALQMRGTAQKSMSEDQGDFYQRKIEVEKRRIAEIDAQIKKMEESILQHRSEMGGVNASRETSKTIQKQIRMLENRLDKALVKFNEALGHNKKLRESIDNLRRERVVFDGIYKKLESDLEKKKNEMASIIEHANAAYEARDTAQCEMLRLKEQADREQRQFEHEWKELGKLIDQDRKMKDHILGNKTPQVVDTALDEEQQLRKRLSKGAWAIVKDKANIHISQVKVKSYEEAFERIQQATGITDIDQLVKTFIDAEDKNFALFNEVNKLSNEIERLEEMHSTMQKNIAEFKANSADNQRKKILEELEGKLKLTEEKTKYYEERQKKSVATVNALKDGISSILVKIGADQSTIEMLKTSGVTESNMMEFLAIIEQKTNALIEEYLRQEQKHPSAGDMPVQMLDDKEAEAAALGVGIGASSLQSLVIQPPSTIPHTDSEGDEDDEINQDAITQQNLAQITQEKMMRN